MSSRLLLIFPTNSYQSTSFMEAAAALGVEVVVACERAQALDAVVSGTTLTVNLQDLDESVATIKAFAKPNPLRAIVGVDDHTALLAAKASAALSLLGNPVHAVQAAGNKYTMRCVLQDAGLRTPRFSLRFADQDGGRCAASFYPCVLKPIRLAASRGVIRADDDDEFNAAFTRICELLRRPSVAERSGKDANKILIEEFIPGKEVALEGLMVGGQLELLALFDKPDPLDGPFFAETMYVTPSRLRLGLQRELVAVAADGARALGLTEGPVHAELRHNDAGIWLVEIAARTIGGLCARTLHFGAHISLEEVVLRHALQMKVDTKRPEGGASGVTMLPVLKRGYLRGIEGLDAARLIPGVEDVVITIGPDTFAEPLPEGDRYLGFIFARGTNPEEVEASLRASYALLSVHIE